MNIDYSAGTCKPYDHKNFTISSEEILDVQKIVLSFLRKSLEFVCLTSVDKYFFYKDERTYIEIQRLMYDHPEEIKLVLLKYYSTSGPMKDLLVSLYSAMCERYNTTGYRHLEKCTDYSIHPNQFELDKTYNPIYERPVFPIRAINDNLYEELSFLLPQNLTLKRAEIAGRERIKAVELVDTIRKSYDRSTNFSQFFASFGIDGEKDLNALYKALAHIDKQKRTIQRFCVENFVTSEKTAELVKVLDEASAKLSELVKTALERQRACEFGSISENKAKLRMSINKLGFADLLDLYHDYQKQVNAFMQRKKAANHPLEKESYSPYINLYQHGEILISDQMNHLNRNKAKHKHIPQELIDQAMRFYYDTDSLAVAYETQRKEKYSQEKESGDIGESRVNEALKWIDSSYVQIQPLSKDYSGNACIYLHNPAYLNVKQEYDHILVGRTGVFLIETKNYTGKLIIDKYGNWRRILQDGKEIGVKNPLEQVRKHEKVLSSFLGDNINIVSIICIANDFAIIEGVENSPLPIIKSDLLVEFIEHFTCERPLLGAEDVQRCVKMIYDYMLK